MSKKTVLTLDTNVERFPYERRKAIANNILNKLGLLIRWDDLPDINSLHDAGTIEDILNMCKERANEEMPIFD